MTAKHPPVPMENLSHKGPGENPRTDHQQAAATQPGMNDPARQGQQANIRINRTPQLSTQDR